MACATARRTSPEKVVAAKKHLPRRRRLPLPDGRRPVDLSPPRTHPEAKNEYRHGASITTISSTGEISLNPSEKTDNLLEHTPTELWDVKPDLVRQNVRLHPHREEPE